MTKQTNRTRQIDVQLKTLIRGLSQENIDERYRGYKALYEIGAPAIPQIKEALFKSKWEKVKYSGEIRYVSGLFSLLHDISEAEAEKVARKIIANGCAPVTKQTVTSIRSFRIADYRIYLIKGVEIFEHKDLVGWNVRRRLERWFGNVPDSDLQELHRVYIIIQDGRSNAGCYTPILFNIQVIWETVFSKFNPLSALLLLNVERTFYHEIGHHVHRHTFGQQPEQEQEAESYARTLMRKSHPILSTLARGVKKGLVLVRLKKNHQEDSA